MASKRGTGLAERKRGSMFSQVNSVLGLLAAVPLTEGRWTVTDQQVNTACATYKQRLRGDKWVPLPTRASRL